MFLRGQLSPHVRQSNPDEIPDDRISILAYFLTQACNSRECRFGKPELDDRPTPWSSRKPLSITLAHGVTIIPSNVVLGQHPLRENKKPRVQPAWTTLSALVPLSGAGRLR